MNRFLETLFAGFVKACAATALLAFGAVVFFLAWGAAPALLRQGPSLFYSGDWSPGQGRFGLAAMLCASAVSGAGAVALATPLALLSAGAVHSCLGRRLGGLVRTAFMALTGLPPILSGMVGLLVLLPALARFFPGRLGPSGGASLLAVLLVLAAVILPDETVAILAALEAGEDGVAQGSLALGATPLQTLFRAEFPAAAIPVGAAMAAGFRRAVAEGMAALLVGGNLVCFPALFRATRTLASGILLEMGYAGGLHRSALFAAALLLLGLTTAACPPRRKARSDAP